MTTSTTGIVMIIVVVVITLAFWLVSVMMAARDPRRGVARGAPLRGDVQGGRHVGGGRSLSPLPDDPVTPGDAANLESAEPGSAQAGESRRARRGTSPMDL